MRLLEQERQEVVLVATDADWEGYQDSDTGETFIGITYKHLCKTVRPGEVSASQPACLPACPPSVIPACLPACPPPRLPACLPIYLPTPAHVLVSLLAHLLTCCLLVRPPSPQPPSPDCLPATCLHACLLACEAYQSVDGRAEE